MEAVVTLFFVIGIFLSWIFIFFGGFGTLLILLFSFLYALLTHFEIITPKILLALALIYLTGEIFDYVFIILGAKVSGASKKTAWGAIIGGLIGAALSLANFGVSIIPLTIAGIFIGAFLVELREKRDFFRAFLAGTGSSLGRIGASFFKAVLGLVMLVIVVSRICFYLW